MFRIITVFLFILLSINCLFIIGNPNNKYAAEIISEDTCKIFFRNGEIFEGNCQDSEFGLIPFKTGKITTLDRKVLFVGYNGNTCNICRTVDVEDTKRHPYTISVDCKLEPDLFQGGSIICKKGDCVNGRGEAILDARSVNNLPINSGYFIGEFQNLDFYKGQLYESEKSKKILYTFEDFTGKESPYLLAIIEKKNAARSEDQAREEDNNRKFCSNLGRVVIRLSDMGPSDAGNKISGCRKAAIIAKDNSPLPQYDAFQKFQSEMQNCDYCYTNYWQYGN